MPKHTRNATRLATITTMAAAATLALAACGQSAAQPASGGETGAAKDTIVVAAVPAEESANLHAQFDGINKELEKATGKKVTFQQATDYAAIIEGQRAGNIHIASYGPSSFARARMTGAKIDAFAIETNLDGTKGYHSVFYVKKDSPYQKVEDLKGKNLGLVDPNSTSGNNVPRFALDKMGIDPEAFFGKVVYTGSHENAIIALQQKTVDVAANWWNDEQESNLQRMARKNLAKAEDFRIIFKSEQIVNSPMAYLTDMPEELKAKIRDAVLNLATKDKAAFDKIYEGKQGPLVAVDNKAYDPIIELNKFVDELRKKKSS